MESSEHNWANISETNLPQIANFWRVGVLDVFLSEYLNKSHNFINFIFMTSSLRYSILQESGEGTRNAVLGIV